MAASERKRIAKAIAAGGIAPDGEAWLDAARDATLARLASRADDHRRAPCPGPGLARMVGGTTDKT